MNMETSIDDELLLKIWGALLAQNLSSSSWKIIPIEVTSYNIFRLGVHFPDKTEAIIIQFDMDSFPNEVNLPSGRGFEIVMLGMLEGSPGLWLALKRHPGGDRKMFTKMSVDILSACTRFLGERGKKGLSIFLQRIVAWQKLMEKEGASLSREEQIGLYGELEILNELMNSGVSPLEAVLFWRGPSGALHDYVFSSGVLEIKSGIHPKKIIISSAEQLDTALIYPIFIAVFNFDIDNNDGKTLFERICDLQDLLKYDLTALNIFESRLLEMGIVDRGRSCESDHYRVIEKNFFHVADGFPAITASCLARGICDVKYSIDLRELRQYEVDFQKILYTVGAK